MSVDTTSAAVRIMPQITHNHCDVFIPDTWQPSGLAGEERGQLNTNIQYSHKLSDKVALCNLELPYFDIFHFSYIYLTTLTSRHSVQCAKVFTSSYSRSKSFSKQKQVYGNHT